MLGYSKIDKGQMKESIEQLAILNGAPAFQEKLHVGRPNIGNRDQLLKRINELLDRRWLSNNGPFVQELEEKIANFVGVKHCIAMCNATIGLEIAIRALGLSGEVILPSMTFIATAHALQWQGITPVFCDIDPVELCLNPDRIEQMITPRTTGIIGVHLFGRICNVDALNEIAKRHGLKLIYDAAHALGCTHSGIMAGGFGDVEIFSFHATKFFNSFEGGMAATNDDELALRIRLMKNFGFAGYDNVIYIGTNGKMSEISAAMGLTSLESMDEVIEINHRNYLGYIKGLANIPGITILRYDESERCNFQYIVLLVDSTEAGVTRDQLVKVLEAENVLARRYFYPGCHRMEPYRSYYPHAGLLLPVTEQVVNQVLSLPTGSSVSLDDVREICAIIRLSVSNADMIIRHFETGNSMQFQI
jgi:dTDP-4-amino-4,6-dideoxygalactose transaminase